MVEGGKHSIHQRPRYQERKEKTRYDTIQYNAWRGVVWCGDGADNKGCIHTTADRARWNASVCKAQSVAFEDDVALV